MSLLSDILKAATSPFRQAAGIGQEIARKRAGLTPEQYTALQQQAGGRIGSISRATSLTPQEARDPLIAAKSLAGIGSYVVPMGKVGSGIGALNKILQAGKVAGAGALSGFGASQQGSEVSSAALGGALSGATYGLGKGLQSGLKSTANRFMDSAFRETIKDTKSLIRSGSETLGKKALEKGYKGLTATGILKNATNAIDSLENKLQDGLSQSSESISIDSLKKSTAPLIKKYTQSGNISAVNSITSRLEAIEQASGKTIPVSKANEIKRALYEEARNAYGQVSSENMEGIKSIARGIKESIAKKVGGVDEINQNLSYFGRISDSMTDKLSRGGRNNMFGLTQSVLAGGGIAGAGATGGASLIPAALLPILGSMPGKTISARTLNAASKGVGAVGGTDIAKKTLTQLSGRAGAGVANLLGEQTQPQGENGEQNNIEQVTPPGTSIAPTIDRNSLPPEKQKAYDIIMQAKQQASAGGGTQAGQPSQEQLGQAYLSAVMSGNTKAATQLKAMYDFNATAGKQEKKSTAEKSAEGVMSLASQANELLKNKDIKTGMIAGPIEQQKAKFGKADQATLDFQTIIGNLKGTIVKARAGAALSKNEEKLLDTYVPIVGDSKQQLETKLRLLQTDEGKAAIQTLMNPTIQQVDSQGLSL